MLHEPLAEVMWLGEKHRRNFVGCRHGPRLAEKSDGEETNSNCLAFLSRRVENCAGESRR